jgi:hypothetical protein
MTRVNENHEFHLAYELGQFRRQLMHGEHLDGLVLDRRTQSAGDLLP